ncbi:DUF2300 domain-containing protein [Actinoplanes sp. L3-i22]|uniref:DUF2300 domain-containing protein n=1 Tax=Actinoplanes sp. L3-i22 TaxID=2836373 RepID=UPI00351CFD37
MGRSSRPGRSSWRSARCRPGRGSRRRSAPARDWPGPSTTRTSSPGSSGSSGPVTARTWSRRGCRRWTGWRRNCAAAYGWPTSAAVTARPRC